MKVFADTSALCKRYLDEAGREGLQDVLAEASVLAVAPVCLIEMHSVFARRLRQRLMTASDVETSLKQLRRDFRDMETVAWSSDLEQQSIDITARWDMRALDAIVLAAGCLAGPDQFVTSDKKMLAAARQLFRKTVFIG